IEKLQARGEAIARNERDTTSGFLSSVLPKNFTIRNGIRQRTMNDGRMEDVRRLDFCHQFYISTIRNGIRHGATSDAGVEVSFVIINSRIWALCLDI
ncbi:hypothetical protein V1478_011145, partial [Vespula squamosa]